MAILPRQADESAIVIGYGNPNRQDDGVGYHLVNALNLVLGRPVISEENDGLDERPGPINAVWAQQLLPEFAAVLARYALVIFVDAHTGANSAELLEQELQPVYRSALVSHHMKPETLLALSRDLYGQQPRAALISIRGRSFDFGDELSPQTQCISEIALQRIRLLLSLP
jgi:hydrogenase maturation protease